MPRAKPQATPVTDLRVITTQEFADSNGLSLATVKRMIARGTGPRVIRLSTKRVGIRLADALAWQEGRVQS
jgi:predicted DNA-binding transcriptional regulator AlpA